MPAFIISNLRDLQRKSYNDAVFRARVISVDPNTTASSTGLSFRVIVSDHSMSMKGTFWNSNVETFEFMYAKKKKKGGPPA